MKKKNLIRMISVLLIVISVMTVFSLNSSADDYYVTHITPGDYFICPSSNGSYALDVINNSHVSGSYVHLYSKFSNTNEAQIFTIQGYDGDWYKIINRASGLCLNVPYANSQNGQRLWVHNPDDTDASLWRFGKAPDGNYVIQNKLGKVIDLDNNIVCDGSRIHLWDLHHGASCRWKLTPVSYSISDIIGMREYVTEGDMKICPTYAQDYSLNVQYKSTTVNSANIVLDAYNGETNEQFTVTHVGKRYYTISPKHCNNRYLAINGSKITLSSSASSAYSQWCFIKRGNGYAIINKGAVKSLASYNYYTGAKVSSSTVNVDVKAQNFILSDTVSWQLPLKGNVRITQSFGSGGHLGVDMVSNNTTVCAAADGIVYKVGLNGTGQNARYVSEPKGNGYYVVIKHTIGDKEYYTMYGHLQKKSTLIEGSPIKAGEEIGIMGNTGNSRGDHLHFAVANAPRSGSYYGYTSNYKTFNAVSKYESRSGITFFDPMYVINNQMIP